MKTYVCTQCMAVFDEFELDFDDDGNPICPHCESSEYMEEDFNNEDED